MKKWVLFLQLEPGQEAYCLFGDKDKEIVVKCECKSVYILEDKQPRYNMKAIKCVHSKDKSISKGNSLDFLFACKNCNINTGNGIGAWPVFTSQEAYKEWRNKKEWDKSLELN